jgi:hypothetical protein
MNFSTQLKQNNTDEWYTTEEAVNIIIPYLNKKGYRKILCPFDLCESNFNKVLSRNGFDVTYSHIQTGTDFFEIDNLSDYDAVVSNPPFSKRQRILEKLFDAKIPFAMIMDFNGLFDSKKRWELFKDNEFELLVPLGRMRFFSEKCKGKSPNFQSIFVCKGMCDKQITFHSEEV